MVKLGKGLSRAMNARIIGSGGETVILAHGYGGDQSVWEKIIPHLAKTHRVVVFDWNFSGAVEDVNEQLFDPVKHCGFDAFAEDLICVVEEMRLISSNSVVFVGHSMSGMIGCIASIKRPDLFNKLVLIGASPRYINSEDYEGGFETSEIETILSNIESNFQVWASNFAPLVVDPLDHSSVMKFENCLKGMRSDVALSVAKIVFRSDERDTLERVTIPCTIVQTTNDAVAPISVADYMDRKIKGKSTVEIIEADGHFPMLTAHLQLLEVLDRVFKGF